MADPEILLSICVPTYNRRFLLERNVTFHIEQFRRLAIPFEIVVVDDCSTDGTADYLRSLGGVPEVRVYSRIRNAGFMSNYAFAMRRARGRYALFLGDDDLLIPEKVAEYLGILEADPSLGMVQAPWMLVDARDGGGDLEPFYKIVRPVRHRRGDYRSLLDFIFDHHVFPEFLIVRRDVLARSVSGVTPFVFWAFLFTGRALARADVMFMPEPFARVTLFSDDTRPQQGHSETMFQWDTYRGGVEYLAARRWQSRRPSVRERRKIVNRIRDFLLARQSVALRMHMEAGNWVEAHLLYHRMACNADVPMPDSMLKTVGKMAGIVTAASEAAAYGTLPVVVDPALSDGIIGCLPQAIRDRLTRDLPAPGGGAGRAWLRMDSRFGEPLADRDAAFDIPDYIDQFI